MNTTSSKTKKRISNNSEFSISPRISEIDILNFPQPRFFLIEKPILWHTVKVTPIAGYGRCRSCECKGYISKNNGSHECKNCNHHFSRHRD